MTVEQFWKCVDVREPRECWPWLKGTSGGYGVFKEHGKMVRANRRALELKVGHSEINLACHTCDNPICCNPAHLFAGSVVDNNRDAFTKGRRHPPAPMRGETHPLAKLTNAQRDALRLQRTKGTSYLALATQFGISQPTAFWICNPRPPYSRK